MPGSVPVSAISDQPSSLVIGAAATDRTAVLKSNWLSPLDRQTGRQREREIETETEESDLSDKEFGWLVEDKDVDGGIVIVMACKFYVLLYIDIMDGMGMG